MSDILEPGMKVECIMDLSPWILHNESVPTVGGVYTVRQVTDWRGYPAVRLVEIVNKPAYYLDGDTECLFAAVAFRPIKRRDTNIEIFTQIDAEVFSKSKVDA